MVIWAWLEFHQLVLAEVVWFASTIPYASLRTHEVFQKIDWKTCELGQGSSYEQNVAILGDLVAHFGAKFGIFDVLRALPSTISNCTSGS